MQIPYIIPQLGWNPRPGLDLDAGIRLQRTNPVSRWLTIQAPYNQYSAPTRFFRSFMGDYTLSVLGIAEGGERTIGPWTRDNAPPQDLTEVFYPSIPAWIPKQQLGL